MIKKKLLYGSLLATGVLENAFTSDPNLDLELSSSSTNVLKILINYFFLRVSRIVFFLDLKDDF